MESEVNYMSANGLKCSGYNEGNGCLELYIKDATIDEVKQVNWDHLDLATSTGTVFKTSDSYKLESIQLNMLDESMLVINLRNIDDPVYNKVVRLEQQLDIQGNAIDALINMSLGGE